MVRSHQIKRMALCLAIIGVIAGCSSKQESPGAGGRTAQAQRGVPVEVKKVVSEPFALTVTLSGRMEPSQQVEVTAKASGRVKQLYVKVGDPVKVGQPLLSLDGEELRIQMQRSEAAYMAAKAKYAGTLEGTSAETTAQTQNSILEQQKKVDAAKKDVERNEALFKEGAISSAEVEKVRLALMSATTSLENMLQKQKSEQKGPTGSTLDSAVASLKQSEADYELAKYNYANLTITAPIDGVIGSLAVTDGNMVNSNNQVAQIINLNSMKVQTAVSESQVGLIRSGQEVTVTVPSLQHSTKGKVVSVSPMADASKMYPVEIEVANADMKVKGGMVASIELKGNPRQATVVPREAVLLKNEENYVFVAEDKKAKQVKVQVGESDGERMEIISGLKNGQEVIIKGQNTLADGATVIVIDPNKPIDVQGGQKGQKGNGEKGQKRQNGQNGQGQNGQSGQGGSGQSQDGQKG
ncbi:MAG: efflux RND transporter periplasmic adaptor subunit [Clostridia bacterium]